MTYSAKDIGRATVKLSIDSKCWVSNLKLQKLLYFSWLEYYKLTGRPLFDEEFQAWKYGPVVPSVYYDYWCNAANTLFVPKRTSEEIDGNTLDFLQSMLLKYNDVSVREMVDLSHKSKPWKNNYEVRMKKNIPMSDMKVEASHKSRFRTIRAWLRNVDTADL